MLQNAIVHLRLPDRRSGHLTGPHLLCSAEDLKAATQRLRALHARMTELADAEQVGLRVGLQLPLHLTGAVTCDDTWWQRWHVLSDRAVFVSTPNQLRPTVLSDADLDSPRNVRVPGGWQDAPDALTLHYGPVAWHVSWR